MSRALSALSLALFALILISLIIWGAAEALDNPIYVPISSGVLNIEAQ